MFHAIFDEEKKLWSSSKMPPIFNPKTSIANVLLKSMKIYGSQIAQISDDSGVKLTFNEIRSKTIRAAQNLQQRVCGTDNVFGIMVDNDALLAPIVFASLCLGCSINPLYTLAEKNEIIRMLKLTKPTVMFIDVKVYDIVQQCLKELFFDAKIFTFNGRRGHSEPVEYLFEENGMELEFNPIQVDAINQYAAIMNSSGTSGQFKGVCLSHAALLAHIGYFDIVTTDDVFYSTSTIHWITALISLLVGTLNGSTRIITTEPFSIEMQLRLIETHKVTVVLGQEYHIIDILKSGLLAKADLSSVKHMIVAGGKIPFAMMKQMNSHLPNGSVNNGYGLTELSAYVTIDFPHFSGKDTIGRLLSGFQMKIIDEDGNRCGIDTDGEICLKGSHKFLGYYGNEELTRKTVDDEGFFLTGDVGRVDKDGFIYLSDRKKDIIPYYISIPPSEIEEVLLKSPNVKAVCVVGVPFDVNIEAPAAVVVRAYNSQISEEDIKKMVADNLADYYQLRCGVFFVDSIPHTSNGKPLRRVVKEYVAKMYQAKCLS